MNEETTKGDVITFKHPSGTTCVIVAENPSFELGDVVSSIEAACTLEFADACVGLARHLAGDWGTANAKQWRMNDQALILGGWLISLHTDSKGNDFGILTLPDRSRTWVVLVQECMRLGELSTEVH
jgi:hypothetical protein